MSISRINKLNDETVVFANVNSVSTFDEQANGFNPTSFTYNFSDQFGQSMDFPPGILEEITNEVDIAGNWCRITGLFRDQRIFIPEQFTPEYNYPLVVNISQSEQSGDKASLEKISRQNYLGLDINLSELGYHKIVDATEFADTALDLIRDAQQIFKVNDKQIYLLCGSGLVNIALEFVFNNPKHFAGILLINPKGHFEINCPDNLQTISGIRIGIVDEVTQPQHKLIETYKSLKRLPIKEISLFQYDDLMVHHNEYEVLNRFIMSGLRHVVW